MARFIGGNTSGSGDAASLVVPTSIKDTNGDNLISFTKTGTGTARISTPQDDLSLRSARDITIYAGDDGPGNVYIGWGDAVYTPDSPNKVATIGDIQAANTADFTFAGSEMNTGTDMTIGVTGVPGTITLSAYAGVDINTYEDFGLTANKIILTSNGAKNNITIGDDVILGDGNVANNLVIVGQQDSLNGGIVLGERLTETVYSDGSNLSLSADNDIILNPGSNYAYIGEPTVGGETRVVQRGFLGEVDRNIVPSIDNEYTLGSPEFRWKNVHIGPGTIYITDSTTGDQVALTIDNGVFFLDGIAQAQLPELITNSIQLRDGNDNIVLRLVEDAGTGKLYFGGSTNGMWQDSGKTYITGISYHAEDSGVKPMYYNSATGEVTYDSDVISDTLEEVSAVPVHDHGAPGDEKNNFAYDATHFYICTADYVNDSTTIWKRINFASGNW